MNLDRLFFVLVGSFLCIATPQAQTNTFPFPSTGNVGIGTTDPGSRRLYVHSSAPGNDVGLHVELQRTSGTNYAVLASALGTGANVNQGVFTTASGASANIGLRIYQIADTAANFSIYSDSPAQSFFAGHLGLGVHVPPQQLSLTGGIGFANQNAADKKLYSPVDGVLEWMTHDHAGSHGFAVSHQGEHRVFLNTSGASFFNGGNVGIGTANPSEKLSVNGRVRAREVVVEVSGWSDYVFAPGYELVSLSEVEGHIEEHGHLPGIPSAREVSEQGISLGEMQAKLLAKLEEVTLHLIRMEKENAELRGRVQTLETAR